MNDLYLPMKKINNFNLAITNDKPINARDRTRVSFLNEILSLKNSFTDIHQVLVDSEY